MNGAASDDDTSADPAFFVRVKFDVQKIVPATGSLVHLRTRAELQARDETVDVYAAAVPLKDTGRVLSIIKTIPGQSSIDLHHLRRVVKDGFLPANLINAKAAYVNSIAGGAVRLNGAESLEDRHLAGQPDPSSITTSETTASQNPTQPENVHIFLAPTAIISQPTLSKLLANRAPTIFPPTPTNSTLTIPVPRHPPTSLAHAHQQSTTLWPTTYNPNTVYGPNPSIIAAATTEIFANAGRYVALARHAGRLAYEAGQGEGVGCVIIERDAAGTDRIVAIAGDQRCTDCPSSNNGEGHGNPAKHAALRAIEMVAAKRRALLDRHNTRISTPSVRPTATQAPENSSRPQQEAADQLRELEADTGMVQVNGYLCLNLHIYVSHEPCVMCSMALVHSRVGRVVFGRRMPSTGGLTAEVERSEIGEPDVQESRGEGEDSDMKGLGYGLFWREELNWRFLCWEFVDDPHHHQRAQREKVVGENVHA